MTKSSTGGAAESAAFFDPQRSAQIVNGRMGAHVDGRLKEVMTVMVEHLHAAIREARVTQEEWAGAIRFLTEVGHTCTDWRQEFILLSDVLGASMLVDALSNVGTEFATESTVLGPFHVADAPLLPNGANICLDGKGEPMIVSGQVLRPDGRPIDGALLEVWQANEDGFYDVQKRGDIPEWNLRGRFQTDSDGSFHFRTVKPRFYPIPSDGPVGHLLTALGRHPYRAAHLHFIVSAPGHRTITTHLFDPDCPYLTQDAVFGVKDSLVVDFRSVEGSSAAWALEVVFTLDPAS